MTESDWQTGATRPQAMLQAAAARLSVRKLHQLAAGFCRLLDGALSDARSRQALAVLEHYHDPGVTEAMYLAACEGAWAAEEEWTRRTDTRLGLWGPDGLGHAAVLAVAAALNTSVTAGANRSLWYVLEGVARSTPAGGRAAASALVRRRACDLLREVVGNPFRPWTTLPGWLGAGVVQPGGQTVVLSRTARDLAAAIEAGGRFDHLPVLADAVEECGLSDPAFLDHCRQPGPHARGCWALDLVLKRD